LIRVVAGIIQRNGRLLICQRRRGRMFELQWEFPGGKLRASETPRDGLARELREELGVAARVGAPVWRAMHRYSEFKSPTEITFFRVRGVHPSPRNLDFERIIWARPGDLPKYDFLPADRELVARLARKEMAIGFVELKSLRSRSCFARPKT
jgi:8-oxo-dGTP diphosphatase